MPEMALKSAVKEYWERAPCGTRDLSEADELLKYRELEAERYSREPFIPRFADFRSTTGRDVLEVGVGAGTDHLNFARAGARCTGVDLTGAAIDMTRRRLALENLTSNLVQADAETLPFPDRSFDYVYSWGVIHHTPDPPAAAREILRVLRPGGSFCVMIYNRHSVVALQAWLRFGLAKGRMRQSLLKIIADNVESPGTRSYTVAEARELFAGAENLDVETVVTAYDMRIGRRRFLPSWTWKVVPRRAGWFHVIRGRR
jgi:ubiquinone/menaquinone biosynthesis C-methylase UbiE